MGQSCDTFHPPNQQYVFKDKLIQPNLQKQIEIIKQQILSKQTSPIPQCYQINQFTTFIGFIDSDNKKQGYGELRSNKKVYAGNFFQNLPEGKGLLHQNNYTYIGNFSLGKPQGHGQQKNSEMSFVGEFENGLKKKGKLVHSQFIYEGEFRNNLFDGKGKINYFLKKITYKGQFRNGKFDGQGLIEFKDKYKYEGEFMEGHYHGKGLMLSDCGQIFEGQFSQGTKYGDGWAKTTKGCEIYANWLNNQRNGRGMIKYQNQAHEVEWMDDYLLHNLQI